MYQATYHRFKNYNIAIRKIHIIALMLFLLIIPRIASALPQNQVTSFPGPETETISPNKKATIFYVDKGTDQDGIHSYVLKIKYNDHHVENLFEFDRESDITWSENGDYALANNYIGSNVSDCSLINPSTKEPTIISATESLYNLHFPDLTTDFSGDHVYVTCQNWISNTKFTITMKGDNLSQEFEHHFIYDIQNNTIARSPEEMARTWYPDISWQEKSTATGDFTCHRKREYALLGKKGRDAYVIVFQDGATEKPEALTFNEFSTSGLKLEKESMEYTYEYLKEIKNEKHHTRSKSDECSALVLDKGDTDPIHIYWDQKTKSFSTWSF